MQILTSIAKLDQKLEDAANAAKRSPEEFRRCLADFALDPTKVMPRRPRDPRSPEYLSWQTSLYELIAGREYQTENEKTPFDHEHMMRCHFPIRLAAHRWLANI